MKINTTTAPAFKRILCLLASCIFLLTLGEAMSIPLGYRFNGDHKRTQFRFQLVNNLIILPIKVNNTVTLRFILDSGTRAPIILNPVTVKSLDLPRGRPVTFSGRGLKKEAKGYVVNNVKLELPGVVAMGMSMVVLEEDYLKTKNFPVAVHGIIGYGLFSRFVVDIDYKNLVITLYAPEIYKPGPLFNTLAIEIHDTKPFIKSLLTISGDKRMEAILLLDTGAGTGLILEIPSNSPAAATVKKRKKYIGRGLGGKLVCHSGSIFRMQIGNYVMVDITAAFTNQDDYPARTTRHGSIGGKILSQFERVVFNYSNQQLYLKKKYPVNSLVMTTATIH